MKDINQLAVSLGLDSDVKKRSSWEAITLILIWQIEQEIEKREKRIKRLKGKLNEYIK